MSHENVEIVERLFDAFNRADWDTVFALYSPDVVWEAWPDLPDAGKYHGHEGVREFNRRWLSSFDHIVAQPENIVDAGEHVVLTLRQTGRGKGSGIAVETRTPMVFTLRNREITRAQTFNGRAQALEAAGLAE